MVHPADLAVAVLAVQATTIESYGQTERAAAVWVKADAITRGMARWRHNVCGGPHAVQVKS